MPDNSVLRIIWAIGDTLQDVDEERLSPRGRDFIHSLGWFIQSLAELSSFQVPFLVRVRLAQRWGFIE